MALSLAGGVHSGGTSAPTGEFINAGAGGAGGAGELVVAGGVGGNLGAGNVGSWNLGAGNIGSANSGSANSGVGGAADAGKTTR